MKFATLIKLTQSFFPLPLCRLSPLDCRFPGFTLAAKVTHQGLVNIVNLIPYIRSSSLFPLKNTIFQRISSPLLRSLAAFHFHPSFTATRVVTKTGRAKANF